MRKLHKKPLIMAAATLALTGTLAVGSAMAYFTTYSTAGGGVKMNMGFTETVPNEKVDEKGKHITIKNTGNYDCFVRVKAFAPKELTLTITHQRADGQQVMRATGITMKYFRQERKRKRNSTSNTHSRQKMTNQKNSTS